MNSQEVEKEDEAVENVEEEVAPSPLNQQNSNPFVGGQLEMNSPIRSNAGDLADVSPTLNSILQPHYINQGNNLTSVIGEIAGLETSGFEDCGYRKRKSRNNKKTHRMVREERGWRWNCSESQKWKFGRVYWRRNKTTRSLELAYGRIRTVSKSRSSKSTHSSNDSAPMKDLEQTADLKSPPCETEIARISGTISDQQMENDVVKLPENIKDRIQAMEALGWNVDGACVIESLMRWWKQEWVGGLAVSGGQAANNLTDEEDSGDDLEDVLSRQLKWGEDNNTEGIEDIGDFFG